MVAELDCNTIAITELLVRDHFEIASTILNTCEAQGLKTRIIKGANDYWCRDFMPIQANSDKLVQFVYDPVYYKSSKYKYLKTDINKLDYPSGKTVINSDIVLDGGNISYHKTKVIITDRVFKDNPDIARNRLIFQLSEILEVDDIVVIPSLPYDVTGHSDGMVRFIDDTALILNDFRMIAGERFWNKLLKALNGFNLILLPNDLHLNEESDNATGDYINMILIRNIVFIPSYLKPTDALAHQIIKTVFPHYSIVPIPSKDLSTKGGILHCTTWNVLE